MKSLSTTITENFKKSDYQVYHDLYKSATDAAIDYATRNGFTVNDDNVFTTIVTGNKKPQPGTTNKMSLDLYKDDKLQKKMLHIQIFGMPTQYELNCYIN